MTITNAMLALLVVLFCGIGICARADDTRVSNTQVIEVFGCDVTLPRSFIPYFTEGKGSLSVTFRDADPSAAALGSVGIHARGSAADDYLTNVPYNVVEKIGEDTVAKLVVQSYRLTHKRSHRQQSVTIVTDSKISMVLLGPFATRWKNMFEACTR